jgi:hypothetical protein
MEVERLVAELKKLHCTGAFHKQAPRNRTNRVYSHSSIPDRTGRSKWLASHFVY